MENRAVQRRTSFKPRNVGLGTSGPHRTARTEQCVPWSAEPSCPTLLRAAAWEFSLGSSPCFHPLASAHFSQLKSYDFVLSTLSSGAATQPMQVLGTPQTSRDWRGWRKGVTSSCYTSLVGRGQSQDVFRKLTPGKGGFLQGDLSVSRKGVYVNWAASNQTEETATSRDERGPLLG